MSIVNKILGQEPRRTSIQEYEKIDLDAVEREIEKEPDTTLHIAQVTGQEGVMEVQDLIYSGDIVLADISFFNTSETRKENIIKDFRKATEEVDGDIVQKGQNQVILTPEGVEVSREKIQK